MKKILITILIVLYCVSVNAAQILWKVDIIGGSYSAWEGTIVDKGITFIDYFENSTIPEKAATDGIDVIAMSSSGVVLSWMYVMDNPADSFESKYGPWLEKDQGGEFEYTLIAQQLVLDDLPKGDSVQFFAGYFDWDNVDYDLDIDLDKFTPYAVATVASDSFVGIYNPGDINPPTFGYIYEWTSIPEPSTTLLALLGVGTLFKRRK